ncbi:MAG: calcium/sodium antiporter [Pseudohongiellaceae bacterium]
MLLDIIIIFLGFVGLIWGADKFVYGSSALARNLGVSPLVIGLTIVAFGTSAPEIFSSAVAALENEPELAIGNALGSNIFNVGIALGVATAIRPLTPPASVTQRELPAMMFVIVLTGLLLANFTLGIIDALLLITVIVYFSWYLLTRKPESPALEDLDVDEIDSVSSLRAAGWLLFGLLLLIISAEALVDASTSVARSLGVSSAIIGLTLVALGTSLPELASTVACALRGHHDLAIGNIVGSNILNLLAVLPFPGLISPAAFDPSLLYRDYVTMLVLSLLLTIMCFLAVRRGTSIGRGSGIFLILVYVAWVGIMYWQL